MDFSTRVRGWWSDLQARRAGEPHSVHFDDSGITQIGPFSQTQLAWKHITAVYAYKKDCFGIDQIGVVLGGETLRTWIEVTEHDEGYQELIAELPHHLPGCLTAEEWWQRVAQPPFETQWTPLYQKA